MNLKHDNAQTAVRTRRVMFKPMPQGVADHGANVLPIGTHLGEFEILDLIGEGGFGIVYLAYDHSLERQVALKEYMPSGLATRTTRMAVTVRSQKKLETFTAGLKSFVNEARMLAQFDSPALVKVHSFWEGNGTAYMVMPYYEGMTLKQALQTRKIVPTEAWIRMLLADLFDAIEILHQAHCLHRDIAPDNILLLKDGRPLLLDFGAARRVIGDLTQCFTAILKPGFAPIEQYADIAGLRQGAWTDIYALAAVVYYLITGKAPPPSVARMVHDELIPARVAGMGRYNDAFLATIDKALAVRPEQRFHSIDELRRALDIMESEPRTLPRAGEEWSSTVARTLPAGQDKGKQAAAAAFDNDVTRHVARDERIAEDGTQFVPPPTADGKPGNTASAAPSAPRTKPLAPTEPEILTMTKIDVDWRNPETPGGRNKRLAMVLGLLLAAGIGIYLGTDRGRDSLREYGIVADSDAPQPSPGIAPQSGDTPPLPALPPSSAASASAGASAPSGGTEAAGTASTADMAETPEPSPATSRQRSEIDHWQMASKSNQASAYEGYLREFPQGRYAAIARLRLDRLQAAATPSLPEAPATATASRPAPVRPPTAATAATRTPAPSPTAPDTKPEEAAWTRASTDNSVAAYREYLRKYPKGGYAALARDRLASLKPQATISTPTVATAPSSSAPPRVAMAPAASPPAVPAPAATPAVPAAESADTIALAEQAPQALPSTAASSAPDKPAATAATAAPAPAPAAAPVPTPATPVPQASLKLENAMTSEPASGTGRNAIKFEDQTMTGDFSVDKKSGLVSGKVKISWNNGNQFEGTLIQGSKEGKGKFNWSSGQRYSGDWANDMPNGKGIFFFPDGSRYEGDVKNGMPHGQGSTRFKNGIVYTGAWVRGKSHGQGRYLWPDGSYWEGEFRDDRKTENGRMYFPNKGTVNAASSPAEGASGKNAPTAASGDKKMAE